jgi:hypothetical protein
MYYPKGHGHATHFGDGYGAAEPRQFHELVDTEGELGEELLVDVLRLHLAAKSKAMVH